jgi:hypothetical protein
MYVQVFTINTIGIWQKAKAYIVYNFPLQLYNNTMNNNADK